MSVKKIRPGPQRLLVRHVRLREKDAEQLVQEQAVEEGIVLLAPGTEAQHLRQQLRRLLSRERGSPGEDPLPPDR